MEDDIDFLTTPKVAKDERKRYKKKIFAPPTHTYTYIYKHYPPPAHTHTQNSAIIRHLECRLPNGQRFSVGTGFTDAQRKNPPKKGAIITFKYQELSESGKPRFPAFLRERNDVTWEDVCENAEKNPPFSTLQKKMSQLGKQHSVLFSHLPDKPQLPDKPADDKPDKQQKPKKAAPQQSPAKSPGKPVCKYGEQCYQENESHVQQYDHPWRQKSAKNGQDAKKAAKQPECKYGAQCHNSQASHLAKYSHPAKEKQEAEEMREEEDERKGEDTDQMSEEEMERRRIALETGFDSDSNSEAMAFEIGTFQAVDLFAGLKGKEEEEEEEEEKMGNLESKGKQEDEGDAGKNPKNLPVCVYGPTCYRKNPQHFLEYFHGAATNSPGKVQAQKQEGGVQQQQQEKKLTKKDIEKQKKNDELFEQLKKKQKLQ